MHEFVAQGIIPEAPDVHALDIAKRLIDYGFHPPTNYFPLIVPEALMIEPTETESKETLDAFAAALRAIRDEALTDPERAARGAPHRARPPPGRGARGPPADPALAGRIRARPDSTSVRERPGRVWRLYQVFPHLLPDKRPGRHLGRFSYIMHSKNCGELDGLSQLRCVQPRGT